MGLLFSRGSWITLSRRRNSKTPSRILIILLLRGLIRQTMIKNVEAFLDVVKRQNLTLNHAKSVISASSINVLGYLVRDGNIRPDPERLRPLKELPLTTNVQSLRRTLGLFAYYAKWIPEFSSKINP